VAKVQVERSGRVYRIRVNDPDPLVPFHFMGEKVDQSDLPEEFKILEGSIPFQEIQTMRGIQGIAVQKGLGLKEHVLGLGEKAFELDRRRVTVQMWNTDVGGKYSWFTDPMYKSINFFICIKGEKALGYLFNTGSRLIVDVGNLIYDKITVFAPERSMEFYVFDGRTVEGVLEDYTAVTGRPFLIPEWALGYQISRYSYYPQDLLLQLVREHLKEGFPVAAVYLDIDYMDGYRMFTWDNRRFPDPKGLSEDLHSMGAKLITIMSPCLKLEQSYTPFREALGLLMERSTGEIYTDRMWPGLCAWIDFLNPKAREWWKSRVKEWISNGIDGVWLDMNEPAVLWKDSRTLDEDSLHSLGKGERVPHSSAHNVYAYYQAQATFEALKEAGLEPFVLTRAAFAGSQKYAAVWTGDNVSSWKDLKLQLSLVLSLSVSGFPYVGCDVGGFSGRFQGVATDSDPELLVRYFQMALFFPLFRNHKAKGGVDQEPYMLPEMWKEKVREVVKLRYRLLPYLSALALEAHETGHPILRPLAYHFQDDENVYRIYDELMVGGSILHAPIVEKGRKNREVYLPRGKWTDFWTGRENEGRKWVESTSDLPIYLRENSVIPMKSDRGSLQILLYGGSGEVKLRDGVTISYDGSSVRASASIKVDKLILVSGRISRAKAEGSEVRVKGMDRFTEVIIGEKAVRQVDLER